MGWLPKDDLNQFSEVLGLEQRHNRAGRPPSHCGADLPMK